jgi:molybdopterin converting factor small subunit
MKVRIHFFGMIAEAVKSSLEVIDHYEGKTIGELEDYLEGQYPQLKNFTYQIALGKKNR